MKGLFSHCHRHYRSCQSPKMTNNHLNSLSYDDGYCHKHDGLLTMNNHAHSMMNNSFDSEELQLTEIIPHWKKW